VVRRRREHRPGDEDPRTIERRGSLTVTRLECRRLIAAQAEDARHTVRGVQTQVTHDVVGGVAAALQTDGIADMPVRVDQAGDDGLSRERNRPRATGNRNAAARRDNFSVAHDDRRVVDRRGIGAVDQSDACERNGGSGRLLSGRTGAGNEHERQPGCGNSNDCHGGE
jgi:hypothetical protein